MNNNRKTVLACIDGSTYGRSVVDYAAWVAQTVDAPLKLLHNIEHNDTPAPDLTGNIGLGAREDLLEELTELEARRSKLLMQQGKLLLEEASEQARQAGVGEPEALQQHGFLSDSLAEMEDEIRVLVVGIRGQDHQDQPRRIGAQLESVIRSMHRPVLVVNGPFTSPPARIMIAYDGSTAARKALDMVASSPLYRGMECHLVYVGKDSTGDRLLEEATGVLKDTELSVTTAVLDGDFETALLGYQRDQGIQLTVMGAFGHSRLRELLFGSHTAKMLAGSSVPLLLLR